MPMPIVLGHEGAGIVERTGSAVRGIVPGDKVVLSFPSCGHCNSCWAGSEAYCVHSFALCFGGQRLDGSNALHRHSAVGEEQTVHGHFFDKLIRFYDFAQINEAIEDMRRGRTIKAVLKVSRP